MNKVHFNYKPELTNTDIRRMPKARAFNSFKCLLLNRFDDYYNQNRDKNVLVINPVELVDYSFIMLTDIYDWMAELDIDIRPFINNPKCLIPFPRVLFVFCKQNYGHDCATLLKDIFSQYIITSKVVPKDYCAIHDNTMANVDYFKIKRALSDKIRTTILI